MAQPTQKTYDGTNNAGTNGVEAAGDQQEKAADGHVYTSLGESGLVQDEEGNIYGADEIYGPSEPQDDAVSNRFKNFGIASVLDDKTNPAYWYYIYDERYCGMSREEYCEMMAARYRQREAAAKESLCQKSTFESMKAFADREQRAIERDGLHPVLKRFINGMSSSVIVDRQGNVVISNNDYRIFGPFSNGLAWAEKRSTKRFGFINRHGSEVIGCTWRSVGNFSEYLAAVVDDNRRCGYVDVAGRLVIPCQWVEAWPFHDGFARVQNDHRRIGMTDRDGNLIVDCQWAGMSDFSEGLAVVKDSNGKCGFIDKSGAVVIPCQWKNAWVFSEGRAVVQDYNKRLGFIDKQGELVVPCRWKRVNFFRQGLAMVSDSKAGLFSWKWVFIDKQGRIVKQA